MRVIGFTCFGKLVQDARGLEESVLFFDPITVPDDAVYVDFSRITMVCRTATSVFGYVNGYAATGHAGRSFNEAVRKILIDRPDVMITQKQRDAIADAVFTVTWVHPKTRGAVADEIPLTVGESRLRRTPAFSRADFRYTRSLCTTPELAGAPLPDRDEPPPVYARFCHTVDFALSPESLDRRARIHRAMLTLLPVTPDALLNALVPFELALKELRVEVVFEQREMSGVYTTRLDLLDMLTGHPELSMRASFVAQSTDPGTSYEALRREATKAMEVR